MDAIRVVVCDSAIDREKILRIRDGVVQTSRVDSRCCAVLEICQVYKKLRTETILDFVRECQTSPLHFFRIQNRVNELKKLSCGTTKPFRYAITTEEAFYNLVLCFLKRDSPI